MSRSIRPSEQTTKKILESTMAPFPNFVTSALFQSAGIAFQIATRFGRLDKQGPGTKVKHSSRDDCWNAQNLQVN